jgi:hypothetical protein
LKEQNIQKITPQIIEELTQLLKNEHGIDINQDIFEITRSELDNLKKEIESSQNPKDILEDFLLQEYRETNREKEQQERNEKQNAFFEQKLQAE